MSPRTTVSDEEYRALAAVRHRMRRFLTFSEEAARDAGIEPQQHQLLLAIRGRPAAEAATGSLGADRLQIRHHSAVGLVMRCAAAGLITRARDSADARRVTLRLT